MNRTLKSIISITLLCLLCIGCAKNNTSASSTPTALSSAENNANIRFAGSSQLSFLDKGMYEIQPIFPDSVNLFYTDFTSLNKIYLCNRPECSHSDENCSSYIPMAGTWPPFLLSANEKVLVAFPSTTEKAKAFFVQLLHLQKFAKPVRTTLFRIEARKLFLMNGVAALLILFVSFGIYESVTRQNYIDANEIYYRRYMQKVQGVITQDKIDWLNEENKKFAPIYTANEQLTVGKISNEQYQILMSTYGTLQQDMNNFNRVVDKLPYLYERRNAQFVYETSYLSLFDLQDKRDSMEALLSSLLCALCFSGLFAMEQQTGMSKVLCATPLGRSETVRAKLKNVNIACFVIAVASVTPGLITSIRDYGLGAFTAPIYSMQEFSTMPEIPLFFMIFLLFAARFIAIRALAGAALALSQRLGNILGATFVSAAAFCLPLLLSVSGATNAKWLSAYPLFHITAMFSAVPTAFAGLFYMVIFGVWIFIANYYLKESFCARYNTSSV